MPNTPVILVGLKCDLRNDDQIISELAEMNQRPVSYEEGLDMMSRIGAKKYFECSAKINQGVLEIFQYAAKLALNPKKKLLKCNFI